MIRTLQRGLALLESARQAGSDPQRTKQAQAANAMLQSALARSPQLAAAGARPACPGPAWVEADGAARHE